MRGTRVCARNCLMETTLTARIQDLQAALDGLDRSAFTPTVPARFLVEESELYSGEPVLRVAVILPDAVSAWDITGEWDQRVSNAIRETLSKLDDRIVLVRHYRETSFAERFVLE